MFNVVKGSRLALFSFFCLMYVYFAFNPAIAAPFHGLSLLEKKEFELFAKDVGAVLSHKSNGPAYSLGITGFELAGGVQLSQLKNSIVYNQANSDSKATSDTVATTSVNFVKGLPFGIDLGLGIKDLSGYSVYSAEARYAVIGGGIVVPSVVVRGASSWSTTSDVMKFTANSLDVSVSKGFLFLVPYAGVGQVESKITNSKFESSQNLAKIFAGLNANFLLMSFGYEYDKTGEVVSHGIKLALKF